MNGHRFPLVAGETTGDRLSEVGIFIIAFVLAAVTFVLLLAGLAASVAAIVLALRFLVIPTWVVLFFWWIVDGTYPLGVTRNWT